jgi:hypothetical protein
VRKGTLIFSIFMAAALLAAAGCGGGDSSVSKQEFEQQLKAACNKGLQAREHSYTQITNEYLESGKQPTPDYQAENIRKLFASYQETTEEIADIGLPEGEEKKAEALIKAREDGYDTVIEDPLATREKWPQVFHDASKKAEAFGAGTCSFN